MPTTVPCRVAVKDLRLNEDSPLSEKAGVVPSSLRDAKFTSVANATVAIKLAASTLLGKPVKLIRKLDDEYETLHYGCEDNDCQFWLPCKYSATEQVWLPHLTNARFIHDHCVLCSSRPYADLPEALDCLFVSKEDATHQVRRISDLTRPGKDLKVRILNHGKRVRMTCDGEACKFKVNLQEHVVETRIYWRVCDFKGAVNFEHNGCVVRADTQPHERSTVRQRKYKKKKKKARSTAVLDKAPLLDMVLEAGEFLLSDPPVQKQGRSAVLDKVASTVERERATAVVDTVLSLDKVVCPVVSAKLEQSHSDKQSDVDKQQCTIATEKVKQARLSSSAPHSHSSKTHSRKDILTQQVVGAGVKTQAVAGQDSSSHDTRGSNAVATMLVDFAASSFVAQKMMSPTMAGAGELPSSDPQVDSELLPVHEDNTLSPFITEKALPSTVEKARATTVVDDAPLLSTTNKTSCSKTHSRNDIVAELVEGAGVDTPVVQREEEVSHDAMVNKAVATVLADLAASSLHAPMSTSPTLAPDEESKSVEQKVAAFVVDEQQEKKALSSSPMDHGTPKVLSQKTMSRSLQVHNEAQCVEQEVANVLANEAQAKTTISSAPMDQGKTKVVELQTTSPTLQANNDAQSIEQKVAPVMEDKAQAKTTVSSSPMDQGTPKALPLKTTSPTLLQDDDAHFVEKKVSPVMADTSVAQSTESSSPMDHGLPKVLSQNMPSPTLQRNKEASSGREKKIQALCTSSVPVMAKSPVNSKSSVVVLLTSRGNKGDAFGQPTQMREQMY